MASVSLATLAPRRQSRSPFRPQEQISCFSSLLLPLSLPLSQLPTETPGVPLFSPSSSTGLSLRLHLTSCPGREEGHLVWRLHSWHPCAASSCHLLVASCHYMSSSPSVCPSSTLSGALLQPTGNVCTWLISQKTIVMFNKLPSKSKLSTPT